MRVVHCEHPKWVYNKYIKQNVLASCGTCAVCTTERKKKWIHRIIQEAKSWKFCRVLLLTYNDDYLPQFHIGEDGNLEETQPRFYRNGYDSRNFIDSSSLDEFLVDEKDFEKDYLSERLFNHNLGLPHADIRDIQNFNKRLNTLLKRKVTGHYRNFRFVAVSEYGETTFRPHVHMLLFFSDPRIAEALPRFASQAWSDEGNLSKPFGFVSIEQDRGHAASYVAKYITLDSNIPRCYAYSKLRPFFTTSRRPPLGMLPESSEEIQEIFFRRSSTRVAAQVVEGVAKPTVVPIGQSLENRLFPKCPLYSQIPASIRTEFLRIASNSYNLQHYIYKIIRRCGIPWKNIADLEELYDGSPKWFDSLSDLEIQGNTIPLPNTFNEIVFLMSEDLTRFHFLTAMYYTGVHMDYNAAIFGVSFDEVVRITDEYYQKKELSKLALFYQMQHVMLRDGTVTDYRMFYPLTDKITYDHYCRSLNSHRAFSIDIDNCHAFKRLEIKSKVKTAYLDKMKVDDPVLFNFIKNFFYAKKCDEDAQAITHAWA